MVVVLTSLPTQHLLIRKIYLPMVNTNTAPKKLNYSAEREREGERKNEREILRAYIYFRYPGFGPRALCLLIDLKLHDRMHACYDLLLVLLPQLIRHIIITCLPTQEMGGFRSFVSYKVTYIHTYILPPGIISRSAICNIIYAVNKTHKSLSLSTYPSTYLTINKEIHT